MINTTLQKYKFWSIIVLDFSSLLLRSKVLLILLILLIYFYLTLSILYNNNAIYIYQVELS